jgi:signal transduction histidine kinase
MRTLSRFGLPMIAFLILAPLALFLILQLTPAINPVVPQPVFHFYIVSFTSLVALIVAAFVLTGVGGIGDAESILVGMAFVTMAAVFAVHGLTTPGIILANNSYEATGWSARMALVVGAVLLLFALLELPPRIERWVVRSRRLLWLMLAIFYLIHLQISANFPNWLEPVLTNRTVSLLVGITVIVLFAVEAWRAWQLFRQHGGRLQLALSLGLPWLAMAQLSQVVAPLWALSWWLYHFLMLMAFVICMIALVLDYEQVLAFDLNRYFVSLSVLIALPLATGLGELVVRISGLESIRWPLVGASLATFLIFFVLVLLVVRHGAGVLDQRADDLRQEKLWRVDFTNLLVHDLKSPLTAIRGNLDILIGGLRGPVPTEQKRHLERARQSGSELGSMIDNLLDVERLESGALTVDPAQCDLAGLLHASMDAVRDIAALNEVTLDASIPDTLPHVIVDENLIRRVVLNLLTNALKFVPTNGGYIYLQASASPKNVMVAVIDNGTGVPPIERERIFEKFKQGQGTTRGGAGLGLTFCKLAVEAHGGSIWVEDNPGGSNGSAFIFTLPANGKSPA